MFTNKRFTLKNMPSFKDAFIGENERADMTQDDYDDSEFAVAYIQAYVINDSDIPPKPLICISITNVPVPDQKKYLKDKLTVDPSGILSLLPEDAIKFARTINMLVKEIFDERNYVRHLPLKVKEDD